MIHLVPVLLLFEQYCADGNYADNMLVIYYICAFTIILCQCWSCFCVMVPFRNGSVLESITVYWMPCHVFAWCVPVFQRSWCCYLQVKVGESKLFWYASTHAPNYMVSHLRRPCSWYSLLCKTQNYTRNQQVILKMKMWVDWMSWIQHALNLLSSQL